MSYFMELLRSEQIDDFDATVDEFIKCGRACHAATTAVIANLLSELAASKEDCTAKDSEITHLESSVNELQKSFEALHKDACTVVAASKEFCTAKDSEISRLEASVNELQQSLRDKDIAAAADKLVASEELVSVLRARIVVISSVKDSAVHDLEALEQESNQAKQQLEATIEELRRATALQKVYHAFDFDGGGQVGEAALLEIGRARRRLGQREGEWSEETNSALLSLIGADEQGVSMQFVFLVYFTFGVLVVRKHSRSGLRVILHGGVKHSGSC